MSDGVARAELEAFLDRHAAGFADGHASALAACFAFPLHVVSDAAQVAPAVVASREEQGRPPRSG